MEEDVKKLLEEQLALTRQTHEMVRKVQRYLAWQRAISVLYLVLILAPIVVALVYLPPVIRPLLDQYQLLLDGFSAANGGVTPPPSSPATIGNILNQLRAAGILDQ